jgi:hypothetical protein
MDSSGNKRTALDNDVYDSLLTLVHTCTNSIRQCGHGKYAICLKLSTGNCSRINRKESMKLN